ncbi:glycosyltransferase [bacterium]|nr:glycosyltransferase [bacterium]
MTNPKVTVLMSVYNGEEYLKEAIDSILNQTFKDFEFVTVNDGSTDRTAEILQSYQDHRIKIINNERNVGLTKSLNKGLKMARGEYVARMDADDISFAERFEKQVGYLNNHPEIALVGTGFEKIDETGQKISSTPGLNSEGIYYTLTFYNCIVHSSVMFRKKIVLEIGGYDENLAKSQDLDLWHKISRKSKINVLGEVLVKRREIEVSISNLCRPEQDYYAKKIFVRNITDLMGNQVNIEKILCFHDEGFWERRSFIVMYDSVLELEKIQKKLITECPFWLNKNKLKECCDYKLQICIISIILNARFFDLIRLLSYSKYRKLFFLLLKRKLGEKFHQNEVTLSFLIKCFCFDIGQRVN